MCGICGLFNLGGGNVDPGLLQTMTAAIAHRGPDSDGFYTDPRGHLGLGFRRLAIIDLNSGDQPIYNEDRAIVTVFNGEIYNYRALRAELIALGHHFSSQTDTEVLVHGYEAWGPGLLERLRGMYAFALWDSAAQKLLLARDRLGKKPLYYAQWGETFAFASEAKALLRHPQAPRRLNAAALPEYLSLGYVVPPRTMFEGIYKLPPASYMQIGPEGPGPAQVYWQADLRPGPRMSFSEAAAQLRTKLEESVQLRLMSDVPLGTFLSGGVDSSAVTALTGQLTGAPVQAFTVGFDFPDGSQGDQKFNSDLHYARQAAQHFACQHHQIILRHDGALAELLPQLIYALDEPVADSAIFQTLFVAALARHHGVPVLLSGDGADEILGGYPFFAAAQQVQRYQNLPGRALLDGLIRYLPPGGRWENGHKLRQKAALTQRGDHFLSWEANFRAPAIRAMLADAQIAEAGLAQLDQTLGALLAPVESPHLADYVAYAKLRLWLAEDSNMRYDKMSMWMSIEARAPFEDQELVNFALGLPLAYKLQGGGKGVLKAALADMLPGPILQRPKWGFNPPLSDWLRGPLRPWVDRYLSAEALRANGFQAEPLRAMIEAHLERRAYHLSEIWNLLVLQLWAALFIHQDLAIPARWSAAEVYALQEGGKKPA